jgi:hypothetical protein
MSGIEHPNWPAVAKWTSKYRRDLKNFKRGCERLAFAFYGLCYGLLCASRVRVVHDQKPHCLDILAAARSRIACRRSWSTRFGSSTWCRCCTTICAEPTRPRPWLKHFSVCQSHVCNFPGLLLNNRSICRGPRRAHEGHEFVPVDARGGPPDAPIRRYDASVSFVPLLTLRVYMH